jgi:outer membrane protein assembly factor BamA
MAPWLLVLALLAGGQAPVERIASIQVHGNVLTTDAEIIRLAGVQSGMPVDAELLALTANRLRETGRFENVEVLKRFASIADPSQIALVIIVDEGPVAMTQNGEPGGVDAVTRRGPQLMYLPILGFEDGYGFSYGIRTTLPDAIGKGSRLSVPLTWGGEKRAAVEIEQTFGGPISRVQAGVGFVRRTNPYFDREDGRRRLWARIERDLSPKLRVGASGGLERISFAASQDRLSRVGADVVFDTRLDPMLARNAVYARAAWDRLVFEHGTDAHRTELEARGYLGLPGHAVIVGRVLQRDSNHPLPAYERPLLGGLASLRGFGAGSAVGDTLVSASAEVRLPLTSPLSIGKFGVSAFVDAATIYDKGERLRRQLFDRGVGGGFWIAATVFRLNVYLAHGIGGSTRAHVDTTVLF